MAGKAVAAVKGMLERVGIKAPWKASTTGSRPCKLAEAYRASADGVYPLLCRSRASRPQRSSWTTFQSPEPSAHTHQRERPRAQDTPALCMLHSRHGCCRSRLTVQYALRRSQPIRPVVPQAEPEHVYDIRYSSRFAVTPCKASAVDLGFIRQQHDLTNADPQPGTREGSTCWWVERTGQAS